MILPNFLVIGAAKSGTTALYRYLKQHPDIYMSPRKEPHFFSYNEITKNTEGPDDYITKAITDFHEYQRLFTNVKNEIAIGEASPTYIYIPGTAEKILSIIPNTKIIAILRHPADRAFSAYMHLIRDGYENILDFDKALDKEEERISKNWGPIWHYKKAGFYYEQLIRYYNCFENEQILVIIYDEFIKNSNHVMSTIFEFLQVSKGFSPDMSFKPNVSGIPKYRTLQYLMYLLFEKNNLFKTLARKTLSEEKRWRFTSKLRNNNIRKKNIPIETRNKLVKLYTEDINKLQTLIKHDLSEWLEI
jgi:hypothetical protein